MSPQSLRFEKYIQAPPSEVYHALTNSTRLREWMCDLATTDVKPNGRVYMAWFPGFYGTGHFTKLKKDKLVAYTWYGRGEPRSTLATFTLTPKDKGTQLVLVHSQLGRGSKWDQVRQNFTHSWESGLGNLVSVLETGLDQRIIRRPMLGILVDDFNPEIARKLGVPVTEGIRLGGVIDGMGAQAAGLQGNDVLVRLGKTDIKDGGTLGYIAGAYKAGDVVEVEFYRGSEKRTVQMKLSGRPIPEIPPSPKDLAGQVEGIYKRILAELSTTLEGISDAVASSRSELDGWNVKENLAHLIHSERGLHQFIQDLVGSHEPIYDDGENSTERNAATLLAYPTVPDLLAELNRAAKETLAYISLVPESFTQRKSSYWRLGYSALQFGIHLKGHLEQIKTAIQSAKS